MADLGAIGLTQLFFTRMGNLVKMGKSAGGGWLPFWKVLAGKVLRYCISIIPAGSLRCLMHIHYATHIPLCHAYSWLQDDLRKDARLMEFNLIVNRCLHKSPEARRRELHIRTFVGYLPTYSPDGAAHSICLSYQMSCAVLQSICVKRRVGSHFYSLPLSYLSICLFIFIFIC